MTACTVGWVTGAEELEAMCALADRVFFGGRNAIAARYPRAFAMANSEHLAIAKDGAAVVSAVASYPARLHLTADLALSTVSVGAVCTDPVYRGQGLSSRLLDAIVDRARSDGVDLLLISGDGPLYQRLGAGRFGKLVELRLPRRALVADDVPSRRHTTARGDVVDAVAAARSADGPWFERTRDELADLLTGHLHPFAGEVAALLLPESGQGYALVRTGFEGPAKVTFVVEHGGSAEVAWAMAIAEARSQGADLLYGRLDRAADVPDRWRPYSTAIEITSTAVVVDPRRLLATVGEHLKMSPAWQAGVALNDGALHDMVPGDLPALLWGGLTTPDTERVLPSFRTDTLNFL